MSIIAYRLSRIRRRVGDIKITVNTLDHDVYFQETSAATSVHIKVVIYNIVVTAVCSLMNSKQSCFIDH